VKTIKKTTSIIFGGSGFIGLHLAKKLLNLDPEVKSNNHKVIIIDKYQSPEIKTIKANLENSSDLIFFNFDMIADPYSNLDFLKEIYLEENGKNINIFHFASSLGPELVKVNNSIMDYLLNFNFYNYLATLVQENKNLKFNKIIFSSTSEVYGNQSILNETDSCHINILVDKYRSEYALQKLTMENLLINFGKDYNQEVIVTRLFNIVGPNQKEGFVISNFNKIFTKNLDTVKKNLDFLSNETSESIELKEIEPFKIYGDGKQSRVFTDVSDAVNAMHLLTTYKEKSNVELDEENKIINSIINIACVKNNTTILNLAYNYLNFYKYIFQNILMDNPDFNEKQIQYLKNELLESIQKKEKFITFIEPSENNAISIGANKRIPTVFKLYKILGYKPLKNINNIINTSLFG